MLTKFKPAMLKKLDLSLILGAASTVIFYAIVLRPSMHHTLIQRYTTEHPVDYVIVAMFLWGIADIVLKTFAFPRESFALREEWLPPRNGREPVAHAHEMLKAIQAKPLWLTESKIGQRVAQALGYVIENGSAEDYREHLNYLSSRGEDTTHARYSLVRFIIAISPVLGFLGTVVHFGTALSGISFDEMADRLPVVVSEMGEAFNTTTVALATAMTMMFALFVCERIEHSFDGFIDRFIERELLNRFEVKHANLTPFLSMVQAANDDALHIMAATFDRQVAVWTQSMESLFQRFDDRQKQEAAAWTTALNVLDQRHESLDTKSDNRLLNMLTQVETRQSVHLTHIEKTLQGVGLLRDDFKEIGRTLQAISHGEGKLTELQQSLSDNLRVLHQTAQIDDALHGLTAAIHLLTTRHRQGGSPESIAA
ncbi:MAG: MotA/TolQ/ExbB proton channel family protein [Planctomycetales bacterium]|nr:MotA/TolQ/ExbB proton channel family protein [Planctomycetales bacterium]